jgi:D-3-phosphoglycerate dehydrogenase
LHVDVNDRSSAWKKGRCELSLYERQKADRKGVLTLTVSCVLVTDHVFDDLRLLHEALAPLETEVTEAPDTEEHTLIELAGGARALVVCYANITQPIIKAAAQGGCTLIARTGIGVDNIDIDAATRCGIQVTNVADYCLDEVADHTIALLLVAARGLLPTSNRRGVNRWEIPKEVHRLAGRVLAVLGVGAIGERVARRAKAFGMDVVGFDPLRTNWVESAAIPVTSLREAISTANAISLHLPLTDETRLLVDDDFIQMLEGRPILVNTSRGGVVDLDAVVRGLDDGRLSAACLDVTEPEPLAEDHPILRHPRAFLTPHMGFYSIEAQGELQRRTAEEIVRNLTGMPPRSPVNAPTELTVTES